MSAAGTWDIAMETPLGAQHALLEFSDGEGGLTGQTRDPASGEVSPLTDLVQDGDRLTWKQEITKPMKLKVAFDVNIDGDTLTGNAKPAMFPSASVTGKRVAAG